MISSLAKNRSFYCLIDSENIEQVVKKGSIGRQPRGCKKGDWGPAVFCQIEKELRHSIAHAIRSSLEIHDIFLVYFLLSDLIHSEQIYNKEKHSYDFIVWQRRARLRLVNPDMDKPVEWSDIVRGIAFMAFILITENNVVINTVINRKRNMHVMLKNTPQVTALFFRRTPLYNYRRDNDDLKIIM